MMAPSKNDAHINNNSGYIWIIAPGRYTDIDVKKIVDKTSVEHVSEYRISEIGKHLIDPKPVHVSRKLIGCEIRYRPLFVNGLLKKCKRALPPILAEHMPDKPNPSRVFMSQPYGKRPDVNNPDLKRHIKNMDSYLRQYDPIYKQLKEIDTDKISDVVGICEDIPGKDLELNLTGSVSNKIKYVVNNMRKEVGVMVERFHASEGLLDFKGFDFRLFNPRKSYALVKFIQNGNAFCCVLDESQTVDFWVTPPHLVKTLHLLEQSISANNSLTDALSQCVSGKAHPLYFYCKQLDIHYSETSVPKLYTEIFKTCHIEDARKEAVIRASNLYQFGITFSYMQQKDSEKERLFADTSVLHNLKALEPIKHRFPELYSEVDRKSTRSEAGKYYLLDAIRE